MTKKITIYQVLPRLFCNRNSTRKHDGTIEENGCGKFSAFSPAVLHRIHTLGFTHIWYTGIIRHATKTDYSRYGIPVQNADVVKGRAGSPYSITDYYDVDPDLADDVSNRMAEWRELVDRTHKEGMKVIIDFVPNHVARQYHSLYRNQGIRDLGADDNTDMNFSPSNNFYYCWGQPLDLTDVLGRQSSYVETPAKATGNDKFSNRPCRNDWYETVKLNYGVDYCCPSGHETHFSPIPDTWIKMTDILLYWASQKVDGFRCDMAEMVPPEFWAYAIGAVKKNYPNIIFIGEVYDFSKYRGYIKSGFDYLYDKVGMYDCLRRVIRHESPASSITGQWQAVDDIRGHMLYFLENHDEQRIASDFFAGDPFKAVPAVAVELLFSQNPFMLYSGQEFGERGMDSEGFSGRDGRTTIFDYWSPDTLSRAYGDRALMSNSERLLAMTYQRLLRIAQTEPAVTNGATFDLMYVNPASDDFNPDRQFAFLRKHESQVLLVVANFSDVKARVKVVIPEHAFEFLQLKEKKVFMTDLLTGDMRVTELHRNGTVEMTVDANAVRIYKFNMDIHDNGFVINEHHKDEFPPAHTAEHLLNQLMIRMFGCERSSNAHIERKKSKMSYTLDHKPSRQEEKEIEREMNRLIEDDLPVTYELVDRNHIPADIPLDRIPSDAGETIRLVRIGDYDVCPCVGKHVRSTGQIGKFVMLGTNWDEMSHTFRIRFKVIP